MVMNNALQMGLLLSIIACMLKDALVHLNWCPFEAWPGIHHWEVIAANNPLAPPVATPEESVGSNEAPNTLGGGN